jgi:hypothetical protein
MKNLIIRAISVCATACVVTFVIGCQTNDRGSEQPAVQAASTTTILPAVSSVASAPKPALSIVRIKAGSSAPFTDSSGNIWQPDQGFDGGDVVDRDPSMSIANTKDPKLFLSEHYGMRSFSCNVPNGKYMANLYFAETFDGITGPGQRVYSFDVQGHDFKDFDLWSKAGGLNRAYIETVPVEVTNGKFNIVFTSNIENPEINAVEILPQM